MKLNRHTGVARAAKPAFEANYKSNRAASSIPRWMVWKRRSTMKLWICIPMIVASLGAAAQASGPIGELPTEEDCLAFIAILPTFYSKEMGAFYEKNPRASGKDWVEKIQLLANGTDKAAQFTYSMLLRNGYCVPQDMCAARRYLEKSRGGPNNWEQMYPVQPPWPKEVEATCN